jgi:hypothetical protein
MQSVVEKYDQVQFQTSDESSRSMPIIRVRSAFCEVVGEIRAD